MTITMPSGPRPTVISVRDLDFSVRQDPPLGGQTRRYDRLGSRHSLQFTLPTIDANCARDWIAARAKSRRSGEVVRMAFKQADFANLPALGSPLVNGSSQVGSTLIVDGLTAYASIEAGRAFSIIVSSRSYLYFVTDTVAANGSGQATISIDGLLLRASPADNTAVEFASPVIEGFIDGGDWSTSGKRFVELDPFTIDEVA